MVDALCSALGHFIQCPGKSVPVALCPALGHFIQRPQLPPHLAHLKSGMIRSRHTSGHFIQWPQVPQIIFQKCRDSYHKSTDSPHVKLLCSFLFRLKGDAKTIGGSGRNDYTVFLAVMDLDAMWSCWSIAWHFCSITETDVWHNVAKTKSLE